MSMSTYDVVVIGAGPGGYVAAIRAAQLGLKAAIIEREHLGGICLNWGCIPTKAMLRSSEVFHLMERAKEFGLKADGIGYDLDAVVKRSRKVAGQLNSGVGHLLKKNKVTTIMGEASIPAPGKVSVKGDKPQDLTAKNIIIATGARARELPGLEADGDLVWTYKHALTPPRMPKKLLVIGSGAIGIEFASFYNTLGCETTVVEVMDRILPVEDAEISDFAKKSFVKQGMKIMEKAMVKKLDRAAPKVTAHIESGGKVETHDFDTVISAVGIVGNTEGLGLEKIGVKVDRTHVVTDPYCRTGVDGIYAIGDIAGAPWLAHKASHEGVMVAELIAGKNDVHPVSPDSIAGCTYCQPQVASVGMTEAQAKEAGKKIKVGRFPFIGNGKAIALGEPEGMIKTVFDEGTGELLGAHMVGAEVTELIQGYVVGRQLETTEEDLMHTVFPHPTLSEMMHESVLDAYGRAIHF
ncbi:MAG: dihydrolipoyl dehydrogenase [Pseudomonadota bacterium]